jgi:Zn-dependent peptidase ImmA (M78 family)
MNIPLRVKNLIKKYDTCDPYRIAKDLNIEVVFHDTPNGINGMWRRVLKRKYIVINKKINEWQRKAVLGHELAHFRCHRGYVSYCMAGRTFFSKTSKENEANEYAAELMTYSSDIEKEYIIEFLEHGWK